MTNLSAFSAAVLLQGRVIDKRSFDKVAKTLGQLLACVGTRLVCVSAASLHVYIQDPSVTSECAYTACLCVKACVFVCACINLALPSTAAAFSLVIPPLVFQFVQQPLLVQL